MMLKAQSDCRKDGSRRAQLKRAKQPNKQAAGENNAMRNYNKQHGNTPMTGCLTRVATGSAVVRWREMPESPTLWKLTHCMSSPDVEDPEAPHGIGWLVVSSASQHCIARAPSSKYVPHKHLSMERHCSSHDFALICKLSAE